MEILHIVEHILYKGTVITRTTHDGDKPRWRQHYTFGDNRFKSERELEAQYQEMKSK